MLKTEIGAELICVAVPSVAAGLGHNKHFTVGKIYKVIQYPVNSFKQDTIMWLMSNAGTAFSLHTIVHANCFINVNETTKVLYANK